jgi:hypothetical protein
MSLGIAFKGPEGIVLAADSRVTLNVTMNAPGQPPFLLPSFYDNAVKLLKAKGQDFVGAVTYGVGSIGQTAPRTAHSFMPEFEAKLVEDQVGRLPVEEFATKLSDFFLEQWLATGMPVPFSDQMIFLIGGYDEGAAYGRLFEFFIPDRPVPREWHGEDGQFGAVWGGQQEFVDRILHGFDPRVPDLVSGELGLSKADRDRIERQLSQLQLPIPYQFLPLQDSVDLSIFLIRMTITLQTWQLGVRGVGGAIDVAAITPTDGFRYVQQKIVRGETLFQRRTDHGQ